MPTPKSPTKHRYTRRASFNDYHSRQIYMITIATEGRKPLFGQVMGDPNQSEEEENAPKVLLSPLGEHVRQCIADISLHSPEVRVIAQQVMPDHIHFIIFVTTNMAAHIGKVVRGLKIGCNKGYRELCADEPSDKKLSENQKTGLLFERNYNDKVLIGDGQLERMILYIKDNPRRLLVKISHPEYFSLKETNWKGMRLQAVGNVELLHKERRIQVRCSRKSSEQEIKQQCDSLMQDVKEGAVLISPFISPGEKAIEKKAMESGAGIIRIEPNGFPELYKPYGRLFTACAQGRLLQISCYPYSTEKITLDRTRCNEMNELARMLSS